MRARWSEIVICRMLSKSAAAMALQWSWITVVIRQRFMHARGAWWVFLHLQRNSFPARVIILIRRHVTPLIRV